MQRRTLLKLGLAGGALLAVAGGTLALLQPGRHQGRLTPAGRALYAAVARAVLGPLLPGDAARAQPQLDGHLTRLEAAIAGMPTAVQAEIDELTTILASAPGRLALVGLARPWAEASPAEVEAALRALRLSKLGLRQQVYQALRELTNAAFFADASTWSLMGYDGQRPMPQA
jgi:hypothetical protein